MASTQDRIIAATLDLMAKQGLSAVTMIDVARTAGVARATLYNHYPDVPSILADAATSHNDEAITGLRQALAVVGSPSGTIEQIVRYIAAISSHGHTLETPHGLPPDLRDRFSAFDDEIEVQIARALADGRASGEFDSTVDVGTSTKLVRHMLNGVSELVAEASETAAHIVGDATDTILAAITSRPEA